ncbi:MAG: excinuclease ABC subunit UvrC [Syntrophomonadaceae bacterium]
MEKLKERLKDVPCKPGVYLFKDGDGRVLYVGKAKILRNRLRSYFQPPHRLDPKVKAMVSRVADFDYIVTGSEVEALILENNLIKSYHPRYNIFMRDDKTYPYLKITTAEPYPRVYITREKKDGVSRYFGPYTDAAALKETMKLLTGIFPLRTCKTLKRQLRPCLNRDLEKCLAPCSSAVSVEEYAHHVEGLIRFMEGHQDYIVEQLEREMHAAAQALEYEKAARLRDQLQSINSLNARQKVSLEKPYHLDVAVMIVDARPSLALVFKIRRGRLVGKDTFWLHQAMDEPAEEMSSFFLRRYYAENPDIPGEIVMNLLPADLALLQDWFKQLTGKKVRLHLPQRGTKKGLLDMVLENARLLWEEKQRSDQHCQAALQQLSLDLKLEVVPQRIEGYDASHLGGEDTVAAMVVFTAGRPDHKNYRRFKIKLEQNNDYASLAEALRRRFTEARQGNPAFLPEPDLILIDGGVGQLHAAREVMQSLQVDVPVVALAEREETIYQPDARPLILPRRNQGLMLLQRVRDEAHRFAIEYNRRRRGKKLTKSILDDIAGIGPRRKQLLLECFGSVAALSRASEEQIAAVKGIGPRAARAVHQALNRGKSDQ